MGRAACPAALLPRSTATSSMTSVPKPLKFLRHHYPALRARLEATPAAAPNRQPLADVVRQWGGAAASSARASAYGRCVQATAAAAAARVPGSRLALFYGGSLAGLAACRPAAPLHPAAAAPPRCAARRCRCWP